METSCVKMVTIIIIMIMMTTMMMMMMMMMMIIIIIIINENINVITNTAWKRMKSDLKS